MDETLPAPQSTALPHPAYAGFWIRAGAEVLDELLLVIIIVLIALAILIPTLILAEIAGREIDPELYGNIVLPLIIFPVMWIYRAGFESSTRQATPGKLVMGIKVTDERGGRLGFGRAIVRAFAKTLSHLLANFGFLMVLLSLRKQGLHDLIAKTLVVRTR